MTAQSTTPVNRADGERAPLAAVLLPAVVDRDVVSMNRFCAELHHQLAARHDVSVTVAGDGRGPARAPGWSRHLARGWTRFVSYPFRARSLPGDVFHVLDQGYAHVTRVLDPRRVIVTCHDVIPLRARAHGTEYQAASTTWAWYRLAVGHLRRVAHVACVSEATRRDVIALVGIDPTRTSVVESGIPECFRPLPADRRREARAPFDPNARLLLHVSSGAPYKNVEGSLAILAKLRSSGSESLLLRVGAPLTAAQRSHADRLGVSRFVVELGSVTDERLVELYNAVDAVIVPSHWEGFGWPAVEALACGAPTVVSDCAPLVEAVDGGASTARAADPVAFATAVRTLWQSPDLRESFRQRGVARARELSWRRAADRYVALYERIAAEASAG